MMLSSVEREHLLQQISSRPVGHHGAEMRLQLVQLRRRPAVRWPANASLKPAACGTTKTGKTHRDLAEQRRHRMVPGTAARLGVRRPVGYFCVCSLTEGGCVAWILRLVKTGAEGEEPCTDVMEINRPGDLVDIANLGLTLSEAKRLLAGVQRGPG